MTSSFRVNERYHLYLLCITALIAAYIAASGLIRFDSVFDVHRKKNYTSSSIKDSIDELFPLDPIERSRYYDRLVIVLVDALRADMVLGKKNMYDGANATNPYPLRDDLNKFMSYTTKLLAQNRALAYVAHASIPTVTMPRLKALMSGKIPEFIDILKNFNSIALQEDNLLLRFQQAGKRIVFYGDETWLKLFPSSFTRAEGTSGFFARDTVEVDVNVTRHLKDELDPEMKSSRSNDWDVLVLHYLGLDHVGHLRGPQSQLMEKKLLEMDFVIRTVHHNVQEQDKLRQLSDANAKPSLILLCSDHGMTEAGNHGGATVEESSALLMFLLGDGDTAIRRAPSTRRMQVDIVPTLALLFQLKIPASSTGMLIHEVFARSATTSALDKTEVLVDQLRAWTKNFLQLYRLAEARVSPQMFGHYKSVQDIMMEKVRQVHSHLQVEELTRVIEELQTASKSFQKLLMQSEYAGSRKDDLKSMFGIFLLLACAVIGLVQCPRTLTLPGIDPISLILYGGFALQLVSLGSSSFIENEHCTCSFLLATAIVAQFCKHLAQSHDPDKGLKRIHVYGSIALLLCIRVLRARNQVANFGRLNDIGVDPEVPGSEFANDDSLSILSTAPLVEVLPFWVYYVCIWGLLVLKWYRNNWIAVKSSTNNNVLHRLGRAHSIASILMFTVSEAGAYGTYWLSEVAIHPAGTNMLKSDHLAVLVYTCTLCNFALCFLLRISRYFYNLADASRNLQDLLLVELMFWPLIQLVLRHTHLPSTALLCCMFAIASELHSSDFVGSQFVDEASGLVFLVWSSQISFFAQGNSHLVTTIDISQAFQGMSAFSQSSVAFLIFLNVFSGPILCVINFGQYVAREADANKQQWQVAPIYQRFLSKYFAYQVFRCGWYSAIVYLMRFHLFIWSVFAPKLLYELAFLVLSLASIVLLSSLLQGGARNKMYKE